MKQILHIFKKDIRRHWPEILISLAFLGFYLRVAIRNPDNMSLLARGSSLLFSWFSIESVPVLMIIFWLFLAVRLVHGEPLIGDRQWWITKPYDWWKILAAKLLFFVVFISLPLFFAQLYLLHHAGFPVFSNLRGVLSMQTTLAGALFLASMVLGSLTKNLWQAALASVLAFVTLAGIAYLQQKVPNSGMSSAAGHWWVDSVIGLVNSAMVVGAVVWQYARRKTWHARGLLLAGAFLSYLPSVLTPYIKLIEQKYPLVDSSAAPLQLALTPIQPIGIRSRAFYRLPPSDEVSIGIPFTPSGIAPSRLVQIDGVRTYVQPSSGPKFDLGWQARGGVQWQNDPSGLIFQIQRKEFEKLKSGPVELQFELAITEFDETREREITLMPGTFWDERLGSCHLAEQDPSEIACTQVFASPQFTATFNPSVDQCEIPKEAKDQFENRLSHAEQLWSSSSALLNPVENYRVYFGSGGWIWHAYSTLDNRKRIYLCPGANVRLAIPEEKRRVRIRIQFDNIHLQDYSE